MRALVRLSAAFLGLVLTAGVGAQVTTPDERLSARLDPETRDRVAALVDSLRGEGLPTEPIIERALEGVAKKKDGQLIVKVVSGFATHLRTARSMLGPASSQREIIAGANALRAGVKPDDLSRVRTARETARYAVALDVLTGLMNRSVPGDTAVRVIVSLVRAGAAEPQYVALLDQVERAIGAGVSPAVATSTQGVGIERAVLAGASNTGATGKGLPSARGAVRTDPAATGPVTGAAATSGIPIEGAGAPAPRGKTPPKSKPRSP
ncbi:MAG: hypothetical protein ACT4R6_00255 [Gemmatimonadaceae bacterium]